MSEVAESAHVRIILADYAAADQQEKLNVVGGGINITSVTPAGTTAGFSVVVIVSYDPRFVGESPAVELQLEDEQGAVVAIPGFPAPNQLLRVGMAEELKSPIIAGLAVPGKAIRPRTQLVMQFMAGLPLAAGHSYKWRVKIDHVARDEWTEPLYVAAPAIRPTIG